MKSCSRITLSLTNPKAQAERILLDSRVFFYELRTAIKVRFSREAQSGRCLLSEIVSQQNLTFFVLYKSCFVKIPLNFDDIQTTLQETQKIHDIVVKKIEF